MDGVLNNNIYDVQMYIICDRRHMINNTIIYKFENSCSDLIITPNAKYAAVINGTIHLYRMTDMENIYDFKKLKYPSSIAFSNNSRLLAIRNTFGRIILFDLEKMEIIKEYKDNKQDGPTILFSPDDRSIITSDWSGNIFITDIVNDKVVLLKNYPAHMVNTAKYDPVTMRYFFVIVPILSNEHNQTITEKNNLLIEIKYPFDQNTIIERKMPETVKDVIYNHYQNKYFLINYHSIDILNENFELCETIKTFNESCYNYSTDCSSDGKYFVVECHSGFLLFNYNERMEPIGSINIGICKIKIVDFRGIVSLFIGTVEGGYILDFDKLVDEINSTFV